MRVGWLADPCSFVGGAELTAAEQRAAAPDGVEVVDCPAGAVDPDLDRYVVHNCVDYALADLEALEGKPATKYWNDVGPWVQPGVREWLDRHARPVCCSPVQAAYMGLPEAATIPPPVDLARFAAAADAANGDRAGVVSVGSWRNFGKAPHRVVEWANGEGFAMCPGGRVDFYGGGPFAPVGSEPVAYEDMPGVLARYSTFVFLPSVIEPFGRTVAEAWAAGCRIVTNELVGAGWWIAERPGAIETAAADFWREVLA